VKIILEFLYSFRYNTSETSCLQYGTQLSRRDILRNHYLNSRMRLVFFSMHQISQTIVNEIFWRASLSERQFHNLFYSQYFAPFTSWGLKRRVTHYSNLRYLENLILEFNQFISVIKEYANKIQFALILRPQHSTFVQYFLSICATDIIIKITLQESRNARPSDESKY